MSAWEKIHLVMEPVIYVFVVWETRRAVLGCLCIHECRPALSWYSYNGDECRLISDLIMTGDMSWRRKISGVQPFTPPKSAISRYCHVCNLRRVYRYPMTRWRVFVRTYHTQALIIIIIGGILRKSLTVSCYLLWRLGLPSPPARRNTACRVDPFWMLYSASIRSGSSCFPPKISLKSIDSNTLTLSNTFLTVADGCVLMVWEPPCSNFTKICHGSTSCSCSIDNKSACVALGW